MPQYLSTVPVLKHCRVVTIPDLAIEQGFPSLQNEPK